MSSRKKRGKKDDDHNGSRRKKHNPDNTNDLNDPNDQDDIINGPASILPIIFGFSSVNNNSNCGDDEDTWKPKGKIGIIREKIIKSAMDEKTKEHVLQRLKNIDGDKQKHMEWFESLLRIPFGKYKSLPISSTSPSNDLAKYFETTQKKLDESVYGLDNAKEEIMNYIAQFISMGDRASPRVIGLLGAAGVGKTLLIRSGLSEALHRPMISFSCGGLRDSSYLNGFEHCYSGSRYGRIAQSLMETECMNPILFFDELDKISTTSDGLDIVNMLIHMTDPVQNHDFADKYFAGIHIDLSKVVFVFSYNDAALLNPILKDRIYEIKIATPTEEEKIVIGRQYLLKEVCQKIGLRFEDIHCSEEVMRHIIKTYCKKTQGVRGLKQKIETIIMKINTARFMGKSKYNSLRVIKLPITLTIDMVEELLAKRKDESDEMLSYPSMYL